MKTRALIFAVTLTAMFFIPMAALPAGALPGNAEEKSRFSQSESSLEHSVQSSEENKNPSASEDTLAEQSFRIYDLSKKEIYTVSAADFVRGAIAAEMGADFEYEALVAQGRAAFSCALYQKNAHSAADYDFSADPENRYMFLWEEQAREIYGDSFDEKWEKITLAAGEAAELVITYNGEPAMTVYHAASAGTTQSAADLWGGEVPYLTEVDSHWDTEYDGFSSTAARPKDEVMESLNSFGAKLSGGAPEQWFEGGEYTAGGYLKRIEIGAATFSGTKLRALFGLRSSAFTVKYENGEFVFTVHGYGHGVGMSQIGANAMAKEGFSAEEILAHYYPGTELSPAGKAQ